MIPGWPYSVIAALEPGRTSWTAVLDAVRLGPDDDETGVTAAQVRDVITRLIDAGHWREGDPAIRVVFDAGYDVTRLAWLLADLPGRLRSDRVLQLSAPLLARHHGPAPQARQTSNSASRRMPKRKYSSLRNRASRPEGITRLVLVPVRTPGHNESHGHRP
jgi:hypothetical protein